MSSLLNTLGWCAGGRRFPILNRLATQAEADQKVFEVQSRDALIEFFTEKKSITLTDLG